MISKIYRHGIANHFIANVYVFIQKLVVIGERLNARYFPNSHSTIKVFISRRKYVMFGINFKHLWSLWV